ncbi:MAG TPA: hypothetical protein VGM90_07955 [Kofleriaceae bacterium]|jgi:hypothetical protein
MKETDANKELVLQFVDEECIPYVRDLLRAALSDHAPPRSHFDFNRFSITLDKMAGTAMVIDDLDVSENGSQSVSLERFLKLLDG